MSKILRKKGIKSNDASEDMKYTSMTNISNQKIPKIGCKNVNNITGEKNSKEMPKRNYKSMDGIFNASIEAIPEVKDTNKLPDEYQKLPKIQEQPKDNNKDNNNNNNIKESIETSNTPIQINATQEDIYKKEFNCDNSKKNSQKLHLTKIKAEKIFKEGRTNISSVNKPIIQIQDFSISLYQDLEKEPWFHGILSRDDIKSLLTTSGSFVVRIDLANSKEKKLMLSCKWNNKRIHFVFDIKGKEIILFDQKNTSVSSLINKVVTEKIPLHPEYKVILQRPILQQPWQINKNNISFVKKIGQGTFGDIWKGTMRTATDQTYNTTIAIKIPKIKNFDKFISIITEALSEVKFMRIFEHDNIVKFYGSSFVSEPYMIVMELSPYGCLQKYVRRKKKKLENKDFIKFAIDASIGLNYIHSKFGIHRDVATRNCLIFPDNKVKISDFGQAIILKNGEKEFKLYSKDSLLPLRWLSPETLSNSIFSYKTDVYSFGILLWELFNSCKEPFATLTVAEIVTGVRNGLKPKSSPTVPIDIINIIENKCLQTDPIKRPSMEEVVKNLTDIYSKTIQLPLDSK